MIGNPDLALKWAMNDLSYTTPWPLDESVGDVAALAGAGQEAAIAPSQPLERQCGYVGARLLLDRRRTAADSVVQAEVPARITSCLTTLADQRIPAGRSCR
jgi:hypothetical protein